MRCRRYPIKRSTPLPRPTEPIARKRRPRGRVGSRFGDHRAQVKYANDLWRKLQYAKEPSKLCPCCWTREWHDAAHCFAKGPYPALRFELDNGAPLCRVCHRRVDSDHYAKELFFRRYIGDEAYERLALMARSRSKVDVGLTILFLESRSAA